ncbi:hypothetical protein [uncultured Alistipes sp.]|jgi:hypothetical protein|uniref:hypothetical protein n=1 Tax=uncultured Alistipes sp. TaxID=538949 RepID=UPI0027D9632E|nr:hypothetical protein [uncultured Alistipes sp.]
MKQKILTKPDFVGTLRAMVVGEEAAFENVGRNYQSFVSARAPLHSKGLGKWQIESKGDTIAITRIS